MLRFIDIDVLSPEEAQHTKALARDYYNKLSRDFKDFNLVMHIKKHDVTGKSGKYSIHARVEAPTIKCMVRAHDRDLNTVVHRVMKKLASEVIHKFRTNTSYKKPYAR